MNSTIKQKPPDWKKINETRARAVKKYQANRAEKLKSAPKKVKNKKKSKINQVGDVRKVLLIIYNTIRPLFLASHPICECNLPGCTKKATEVHHKKGRQGFWLIVSHYFLATCSSCHRHITVNSKEAIELNLSLPRNSPAGVVFNEQELELIEKYNIKPPKQYGFAS